jgi:PAS domain-containing protein
MLKNEEAAEPFGFPPMLWRSLTKVYGHGNFFDDTVPEDSLTDCMRENIVANSPWVAWRRLDRMPAYNWSGKSNHMFAVDKVVEELDTFPVLPSTIPKAPVYKLPDFEQTDSDGPQQIAGAACAPQTSQELVQEISVVQTAKEVVKDYVLTGKLEELPENLPLDRSDAIEKLLQSVDPRVVSELSSLSLNQVRGAIEQLKSYAGSGQAEPESMPGPEQKLNLTAQQTVAQVASVQFDRAALTTASSVTGSIFSPGIKDLVGDLRTEAQRIFLKADQIEGVQAGNVQEVVKRMNAVATELLKRADFVLITDPAGKIVYCNGAFIQLISSPDESSKILSPEDTAVWQEARAKKGAEILAGVALGSNNVSSEELPEGFRNWKVQRAKMRAGDSPGPDDLNLDILRLEAFDAFTDEQLRGINTIVSELTNFTSLLAYGSKENMGEYLTGVEENLGKLEQAVAESGTAKEK